MDNVGSSSTSDNGNSSRDGEGSTWRHNARGELQSWGSNMEDWREQGGEGVGYVEVQPTARHI